MGIARIGLISTAGVAVGGIAGALVGIDGAEELISEVAENMQDVSSVYADLYENMPIEPEQGVDLFEIIRETDSGFYEEMKDVLVQAQLGFLNDAQIAEGLPPIPQNVIDSGNLSGDYMESYKVLSDNLGVINEAGKPLGENGAELIGDIGRPALAGSGIVGGGAMFVSAATDKPSGWKERIEQERNSQAVQHNSL